MTSVISPGRRRASSRIRSTAWRSLSGRLGGGQLGVAEALRPVRLRRRLERPDERGLAAHRDLDVGATGELQDRPRVDADLLGIDVARDAGHGDQLGVGRRGRVEQGEAVVDAGVDIEDQGNRRGHLPDATGAHVTAWPLPAQPCPAASLSVADPR